MSTLDMLSSYKRFIFEVWSLVSNSSIIANVRKGLHWKFILFLIDSDK